MATQEQARLRQALQSWSGDWNTFTMRAVRELASSAGLDPLPKVRSRAELHRGLFLQLAEQGALDHVSAAQAPETPEVIDVEPVAAQAEVVAQAEVAPVAPAEVNRSELEGGTASGIQVTPVAPLAKVVEGGAASGSAELARTAPAPSGIQVTPLLAPPAGAGPTAAPGRPANSASTGVLVPAGAGGPAGGPAPNLAGQPGARTVGAPPTFVAQAGGGVLPTRGAAAHHVVSSVPVFRPGGPTHHPGAQRRGVNPFAGATPTMRGGMPTFTVGPPSAASGAPVPAAPVPPPSPTTLPGPILDELATASAAMGRASERARLTQAAEEIREDLSRMNEHVADFLRHIRGLLST